MILYEVRSEHLSLAIYERKGSRHAFFPWQREPHLVAQFYFDGVMLPSTRFAVLGQAELDDVFKFYNKYKDMR